MSDADILAAINAGIEEGSTLPAATTTGTTDDSETDESAVGSDDGAGAAGAAGETGADGAATGDDTGDSPVEEADAARDANGQPIRDEKGRFVKKTEQTAETPEQKAAREAAAKAEADKNKGKTPEQIAADKKAAEAAAKAKADPVNAPIPKELKTETRERIQALVKVAREETAKAAEATKNIEFLMSGIQNAKASPEQYGQSLNIIGLINSGDRAKQEKALELLQQETATLAKILGKAIPGVDMLAEHPDLTAEVATGKLTKERAQELAAMRSSNAMRQQQQQQQQTTTAAQEAASAELATAKTGLNQLEAAYAADPQWPAKKAFLTKSLQETFKHISPKLWVGTFERAYKALPANFGAVAATAATGVTKGTPLRAKAAAGAQVAAPGSPLEALNAGIAAANGVR